MGSPRQSGRGHHNREENGLFLRPDEAALEEDRRGDNFGLHHKVIIKTGDEEGKHGFIYTKTRAFSNNHQAVGSDQPPNATVSLLSNRKGH